MALENRNLAAGTKLVATYKKAQHPCEVVATENGIAFQLADGKTYMSPSSAGKAITGRVSCDGWKFWSLAEGQTNVSAAEAPATPERKAKAPKASVVATKMVKLIKKLPNQKGVAEGSTRFFCSGCMKAFITESTLMPETCPEGHPREAADDFGTVPAEVAATE
jgi:hypothetical protein